MKNNYFLVLLIVGLLSINMVSALEIDNVKSYDANTRTAIIKNSFLGIPTTQIASVQLLTPLNVKVPRGYQKVAEFKITGFKDYKDFVSELEFYDLKAEKNKINRDYDLKVKGSEEILIDDYENIITGYLPNGTEIYNYEKTGSHYETRETWTKLTPSDIKKNDFLIIGIFTDVQAGDKIDWVPTVAGVKIPEWASYEENLKTDLEAYYPLDETTGTALLNIIDDTKNATLSGTMSLGQTGLYGTSIQSGNVDTSNNKIIVPSSVLNGEPTYSWIFWFKETASTLSSNDPGLWSFAGGSESYQHLRTGNQANSLFNSVGVEDVGSFTRDSTAWHMSIFTYDGTTANFYIDDILTTTETSVGFSYPSTDLHIGSFLAYHSLRDGYLDEIAIWSRNLTRSEITFLYAEGVGLPFGDFDSPSPTVKQIEPDNNTIYTTSPQIINFICNATDGQNLTTIEFYLNEELTQVNSSGINDTDYTFTETLEEGLYNWSCTANDNDSNSATTDTLFFTIDSTAPQLILYSPTENITTDSLPINATLNVSTVDDSLDKCWYSTSDNITNISYVCNEIINISFDTGGDKIIYIYANDTIGYENNTNTNFFINFIEENETIETQVVESETHALILTITASQILSLNGTLNYNNTVYNTTATNNGTTGILTTTLTAPAITENENVTLNWTYNLNGVEHNTTDYYQQVIYLTPLVVSASCDDKALKFEFKNEENLSSLDGNINYNFKYGVSNNTLKELHGTLTNISTFYVCINSSVSNAYTLGYGEIQYSKEGYTDRRYYTYVNRTITNVTAEESLFLLENADATSFLYSIESSLLAPYVGAYISLIRWYPELDIYDIVEMAKTDEKGQTIMRVKTEDVDYRVGVNLANGTLISLREAVRFACLSSPCSYAVKVSDSEADYTSYYGVESSLTYDENTFLWSYVWNDPAQITESIRFVVRRKSAGGYATICEETGSGYIGSLSCNSSGYTGLLEGVAFRTASPEIPIASLLFDTRDGGLTTGFGLFISVIITLALMLIGLFSPVAVIILGVVGLFFSYTMGVVPLIFVISIGVIGGLIIHFLKKA